MSRCAATANASRTYIPLEYFLTGVSMKRSISENATISSKRRRICAIGIPRIEPLRKILSRPVSSGWKPVPTSSRLPIAPWMSAYPDVGSVMRDRILRNVLLPAPLRPMMPTISPVRI